ncbi:MAG: DUF370 domain-containing protein [Clostridia bacterium]|nr:DUF370 domain-containing protein [Clostridia bacterium]
MFIHLGQDTVVTTDEIVGIFDLDTTTISKPTRDYLAQMERSGRVVNVSFELPKTFIITSKKGSKEKTMYISPISSATLRKRIKTASYLT